jgi:hypothetical protein
MSFIHGELVVPAASMRMVAASMGQRREILRGHGEVVELRRCRRAPTIGAGLLALAPAPNTTANSGVRDSGSSHRRACGNSGEGRCVGRAGRPRSRESEANHDNVEPTVGRRPFPEVLRMSKDAKITSPVPSAS